MNIKTNSKEVNDGDVFVAIKGNKLDGHNYINEAINNGASLIVLENGICNIDYVKTKDTKLFLKNYVNSTYYNYVKDMILVGITGTNGKTTSCFLLYEALKKLNIKVSYIGTLGFYIDDKVTDLDNTTPDISKLYELLLISRMNDVKVVVMEVSSQALSEDRLYGIKFDYVVFTNLTQDHMDYHKNIDNYLNAKKKLFEMVKDNNLKIINNDSKYRNEFLFDDVVTYGFNSSNFKIINYKLYINKTIYKFKYNNKIYKVKINIPGKYNIYNSIISLIILNDMGFSIKKSIKILNKSMMPQGRMQMIKYKKGYAIIDYAHTPDAVFNVLNSAKEFKKGKIITIIGCGGNRDKTKRSLMAKIATDSSDYVIFTNDNPRYENGIDIINDMIYNLDNENYEIELDRSLAIKKGLDLIDKKDILFILGKGHEKYQIINGIKKYFDDYEEVIKNK